MAGKRVLFPILNWGLGHASRSLPIISRLLERGHHVTIASDGEAADLLKAELPQLLHITLPGYDATYAARYFLTRHFRLAMRTSKAVKKEHHIIGKLLQQQPFDVIISDNRYGPFHSTTRNVIITHQITIPLPPLMHQVANQKLTRYLQEFDYCWVPDVADLHSVSGALSEGSLTIPKRYIGNLSRFTPMEETHIYDLAVVLSGPEPQRTMLQSEVLIQLEDLDLPSILVLGTSDQKRRPLIRSGKITMHQYLTSKNLNRALCQSKMVISRSGYTTIMDLIRLGKPGILIPTPGQPEQQYLASYHAQNPLFEIQHQGQLNIAKALQGFAAKNQSLLQGQESQPSLLDTALQEIDL